MQRSSGTVQDPATAELVIQNRNLFARTGKSAVPAYMMLNSEGDVVVVHGNLLDLLK